MLGHIPQKTFEDRRVGAKNLSPLHCPSSVRDHLRNVLRLVSVGSKRFLTNKVDRSVTGLIARQQCCGPLQLTVGDVAVVAQSHFGLTGIATAIGEQPVKMLINPAKLWRTTKVSYFFLYCFQHDIENITLNTNCSLEIRVAEDAYVFASHSFFINKLQLMQEVYC